MTPPPTINVNLKPCTCAGYQGAHLSACLAEPVLIPCPIPGSFTVEVQLGECDCIKAYTRINAHKSGCPGMPVKVSCSITGDGTWAGSTVLTCDNAVRPDGLFTVDPEAALAACRARWEIVKALVTGKDPAEPLVPVDAPHSLLALFAQRDAMFSHIADLARLEAAGREAVAAINKLIPGFARGVWHDVDGEDADSARLLATYVERLVEQVGVL